MALLAAAADCAPSGDVPDVDRSAGRDRDAGRRGRRARPARLRLPARHTHRRQGKGGKSRALPLHPTATSAVRQYLDRPDRPVVRNTAALVSTAGTRLLLCNVQRRLRGGERPQPVADGADPPARLVGYDHRAVAHLLAQQRVERCRVAGNPMQQVRQTARGDVQAERVAQQVGDLRQRRAHHRVQLDHQRGDAGTELRAGRAQGVGSLQRVPALHAPLTLRAVADLDIEAAHERTHRGQVFLILLFHARHGNGAAAIRTRRRDRGRKRLVGMCRTGAASLPTVPRTGLPAGTPATTLRPVLRKQRRLPAPCLARRRQLLLQPLVLPLQAVDFALQAVDLPLLARVLAFLFLCRRARAASTPRGAVRARRANLDSAHRRFHRCSACVR